jgi:hypothetical protein
MPLQPAKTPHSDAGHNFTVGWRAQLVLRAAFILGPPFGAGGREVQHNDNESIDFR